MFIFNFIVNKGGKEEESNRVLEHRVPTSRRAETPDTRKKANAEMLLNSQAHYVGHEGELWLHWEREALKAR